MLILALDFDGVVCDSSREVFAVAVTTHAHLEAASRLVESVTERRAGRPWAEYDFASDPTFRAFQDLTPLGNRAEDFGVAMRALDLGLEIADQDGYDAFYRTLDPSCLADFHRRFYVERATLRDHDRDGWLALNGSYPPFLDLLRRRSADVELALATAKDGVSARTLLDSFGVGDLFDEQRLLDKDTGVHKTDHLRELQRRAAVPFEDITFVDDKVNHLERVAPLGVRPVLAAWGFNSAREHDLARRHGFAVASLEDAEAVLFERNRV